MEILEKYQDKLYWDEISENGNIRCTVDGVKKFSCRIDWSEFSYHCHDTFICEATLREFRDKFQSHIPMAKLQDSRLWEAIVEKRAKQLMYEALGAK